MIEIWRICRSKFAAGAFSGIGAKLFGGRWNPAGLAVVYASESLALAALEAYVHFDPEDFPSGRGLVAISAEIPDRLHIDGLEVSDLPRHWRRYPAPGLLRKMGEEWLRRGESAVLSVPSAVIPLERNYLLNPVHPDFHAIVVRGPQPFSFDPRMRVHRRDL